MSEAQLHLFAEAKRIKSISALRLLLAANDLDESSRFTIHRAAFELIESFATQREMDKIECCESELQFLCGPFSRAARYLWHMALIRE
jgi:hypothetical protein